MLIKRLVLKEYKRLMLNNIKEIEYTPNSPFQLILGTNGSGKSSLLRELSPLPAFSGDYTKDGSKTIELEENNNNYILTSTFKNGNKHSFIRNGEVLNDEGTAMVQKELIEKYFSYTQEIHDLLIGDIQLTDMAPQKRREWFTKLSPNNLEYAIAVFNHIKSRVRDTQGAQLHVSKRLTAETNKLLSLTDIEGIDDKVATLKKDIIIFLESKDSQFEDPDKNEQILMSLLQEIEEESINIIKRIDYRLFDVFTDPEDVERKTHETENEYNLSTNTLKLKINEYVEMENLLNTIQQAGVSGLDGLKEKKNNIEKEKNKLLSQIKQFHSIENVETVVVRNDDVLSLAEGIISILPDNESGVYSKEKMQLRKVRLEEMTNENFSLRMAKNRSEERYELIQQAKEVECPQCRYSWKPGISENELESLSKKIEIVTKKLESLDSEMKHYKDYLEKAEEYISNWKRFKNIVDDNPQFKQLWDCLLEDNLVIKYPKKAIVLLYTWKEDSNTLFRLMKLEKELNDIQIAFDAASAIESTSSITAFNDRLLSLTKEIELLTIKNNDLKGQWEFHKEVLVYYKDIFLNYKKLESKVDYLIDVFNQYQKGKKNVILNKGLTYMNMELGQIQNKLNEVKTLENLINELNKDSAELEIDYSGYKLLMDELSPVNGLIADQLYGNIKCIVSQMNEIISQIWTYDLEILPCGLESNDLDYKFPIQVKSASNIVKDINDGSTAQVEIINFAFKLVVMLYLNMSHYPLYLDELGHSFDEQHRANVMNYIKLLVDSKRHSQLFMISHYAPQYGSMTQAEICVLDSRNISMPFTHNQHVTFR